MNIFEAIIDHIEKDAPVKEVRKGLYWTAVVSSHCGLASTMIKDICAEDDKEDVILPLYAGRNALEIANLIFSDNISDASLALAAINSLINIDESCCVEMNAEEFLVNYGTDKNVSVIGHFPFTERLRKVTKNLWVIEKHRKPGDVGENEAEKYFSQSDLIAISSTTLINHTLQSLLKLCPGQSVKILLGPTTPMTDVLFDFGIDIVCGSKVIDEQTTLRSVSEGANFRQLKRSGSVKLLSMTSPKIMEKLKEENKRYE